MQDGDDDDVVMMPALESLTESEQKERLREQEQKRLREQYDRRKRGWEQLNDDEQLVIAHQMSLPVDPKIALKRQATLSHFLKTSRKHGFADSVPTTEKYVKTTNASPAI